MLYKELTAEQQATSDFVRLTCEGEICWGVGSVRWHGVLGMGKSEELWNATYAAYFDAIPAFLRPIVVSMVRVNFFRDAWGQGLARHSPNDQKYLVCRAVQALSTSLGSKEFFLGDFPSECDCIALGALGCALDDSKWNNELTDFIRAECPNLEAYERRTKALIFPDRHPGDLMTVGKSQYKGIPPPPQYP